MSEHRPVLYAEILDALAIKENGIYIDGTFGRGGHSRGILDRLGQKGRLIVIDKDPEAIAVAEKLSAEDGRITVMSGSFAQIDEYVDTLGLNGQVDGVLLDLGVSSPQLDNPARGFSFMKSGPLDMRMDPEHGLSAREWLAQVEEKELIDVIRRYGEERQAKRIARGILAAREEGELTTTDQLADLIENVAPKKREQTKHPATRTFQAIRIYLNREIEDLKVFLGAIIGVLNTGGRLAVISFHSLEDREVKRFLREKSRGDNYPPDLPVMHSELIPDLTLIGKAIKANSNEVSLNPRSRSAVLRVAEKLS